MAKRGLPSPTRAAPAPSPRTRRGSIERLQQRVADARTNVVAAMGSAAEQLPVVGQLDQAAYDWRIEAERIERDLRVAQRLIGEPRKQSITILKGRVDELVVVSNRIVDTAFVERLTPSGALTDRLRNASERLDALEQAHRELDELHVATPGWGRPIRGLRLRVLTVTRRRP